MAGEKRVIEREWKSPSSIIITSTRKKNKKERRQKERDGDA